MTVKELIDKLELLDKDANIGYINSDYEEGTSTTIIDGVSTQEIQNILLEDKSIKYVIW